MEQAQEKLNAEVISVYPNKVKISVDKIEDFRIAQESLRVGSYVRISDNDNAVLMAIIENFSIETIEAKEPNGDAQRKYILEADPLGIIKDGVFIRGGDSLAIPPKKVEPAREEDIKAIYENTVSGDKKFTFSSLSSNPKIKIPVDGNKFFNKHIAIVGSTGSGKSHTLATILQNAASEKSGDFALNNSHIIVFDIHSEYKTAFPAANHMDVSNLVLPYWLLNGEELEEILLDTGERDNYNQASVFRTLVTENKKLKNPTQSKIFYDAPLFFDINEVLTALNNLRNETVNFKDNRLIMINDGSYNLLPEGKTDLTTGLLFTEEEKIKHYFKKEYTFHPNKPSNISNGDYADGTLDKFALRLQTKVNQARLNFLFGEESKKITFEETLQKILGYSPDKKSNVTVIDLSGVPFEVLSITVSFISRLVFEYGYYYKRHRSSSNPDEKINNDIPFLLVYEEAHKYVPNSDLSRYRSSRKSIERIAKEGRKYGVTLLLASQRPSEISETIFSQCNNFIAMRLTNPNDQAFVKKLLPDTLGNLIDTMPSLRQGEALLIGESIVIPSIVQIDVCQTPPSSSDIPYWELWKDEWKNIDIDRLKEEWHKY
jgi:uncharacterized protein